MILIYSLFQLTHCWQRVGSVVPDVVVWRTLHDMLGCRQGEGLSIWKKPSQKILWKEAPCTLVAHTGNDDDDDVGGGGDDDDGDDDDDDNDVYCLTRPLFESFIELRWPQRKTFKASEVFSMASPADWVQWLVSFWYVRTGVNTCEYYNK